MRYQRRATGGNCGCRMNRVRKTQPVRRPQSSRQDRQLHVNRNDLPSRQGSAVAAGESFIASLERSGKNFSHGNR